MQKLKKYKSNLSIVTYNYKDYLKSFSFIVASIDWHNNKIHQLRWWNKETEIHMKYAAKELGLEIIKQENQ